MSELDVRRMAIALSQHWAWEYGISPSDIFGYSRRANIAEARQRVYLECSKAGATLAAIGRAMNRDHTTIMHGVSAARKRLQSSGNSVNIVGPECGLASTPGPNHAEP
jgi:chromosomal replication initiation ATPase DnaA